MKLTGRLADVVAARASGGLLGDIKTHLIHEADKPSDRRQDIIHPSEVAHHDWCPRATYYRIRDVRAGHEVKAEQHGVGTLAIFDEGHSIHGKYQGWLRKMGVLKGRWDCQECGHRGVAWPDDPGQCPRCGSVSGVVYGEVPLDAVEQSLIGGHADGMVDDALIEIKSIGIGTIRLDAPELLKKHTHKAINGKNLVDLTGLWDAISRPLPSHLKQANVYLWLAKLLGIPATRMIFLYEFKANQQTKSFEIKLSDRIIKPLLKRSHAIKIGLDAGAPPDRVFEDPKKNPCKSCTWLKECYADNSPEQDGRSGETARGEGSKDSRGNVRAGSSRRRAQQDSQGRDRTRRQRTDGLVLGDERVGELPQHPAGTRTGRREVRRVRTRNSTLRRGPGEKG
ncbi:hypothetical protein [Nonomuraea typhae]|uniref:PD-(D/E)XK endonuclease-like domain-containing protein n=1 Tax=Nonomuraea typhae TaxID=2603600 RepID=A0ABW7YJ66_9ACTN